MQTSMHSSSSGLSFVMNTCWLLLISRPMFQNGWSKWGAEHPDWYAHSAASQHPDWYNRRVDTIRGADTKVSCSENLCCNSLKIKSKFYLNDSWNILKYVPIQLK